jgi:glycosyltransferase involved in cell wall biosynthesis
VGRFPAEAMIAAGHDVVVNDRGPTVVWDRPFDTPAPPPEAVAVGVYPPNADVVVMHRASRMWWAQIIPMIQSHGIRVVVDIDDRLDRIHPDHVGRSSFDPNVVAWNNHQWADQACKAADVVTATTPALIARYGHGHGVVLPNLVPTAYLDMQPRPTATVGWTGHVGTHSGDLETAGPGIGRVATAHGWTVHVVGTGQGVPERLGVRQVSNTGWVPFDRYPAAMAQIGVGIVPLGDTVFNRAKSALKMSEFAALGVPVVASATPDNKRMHLEGVGLLARSPADFERHVTHLLRSPSMRADLAGSGRQVMAEFTYDRWADRWHDGWLTGTHATTRN